MDAAVQSSILGGFLRWIESVRARFSRNRRSREPCVGLVADRKSVVEGKSVDLGGRGIMKKKTQTYKLHSFSPPDR